MEMEKGKVWEKEAQCWEMELLKDLQEMAGSCAEQGGHVDHVGPWQWVAVGHLEAHLELEGT